MIGRRMAGYSPIDAVGCMLKLRVWKKRNLRSSRTFSMSKGSVSRHVWRPLQRASETMSRMHRRLARASSCNVRFSAITLRLDPQAIRPARAIWAIHVIDKKAPVCVPLPACSGRFGVNQPGVGHHQSTICSRSKTQEAAGLDQDDLPGVLNSGELGHAQLLSRCICGPRPTHIPH